MPLRRVSFVMSLVCPGLRVIGRPSDVPHGPAELCGLLTLLATLCLGVPVALLRQGVARRSEAQTVKQLLQRRVSYA